MIKRRLAFATPFVLVASCRAPAPEAPREDETHEDEAPVVVALPQPIDAALPVEPPDLSEAVQVARDDNAVRDAERTIRDTILGEGNPPAPFITAEVIKTQPDGYEGSRVTFDAGSERGVMENRATARLLRGDTSEPLGGGQIKILHCARSWCEGMVTVLPGVVARNPRVEIRARSPSDPEPEFRETRRQVTCCVNPPRPPRPPKPPPPPKPMLTRILATRVVGNATEIVIGLGTELEVNAEQFVGLVLFRDSTKPVPGGEVTLTSCKRRTCTGTVRLTVDQLQENSTVSVRRKDVEP